MAIPTKQERRRRMAASMQTVRAGLRSGPINRRMYHIIGPLDETVYKPGGPLHGRGKYVENPQEDPTETFDVRDYD